MQRVNQNLIVPSWRTISEEIFCTHNIFCLDAIAVKRIRGSVADFILVVDLLSLRRLRQYYECKVLQKTVMTLFLTASQIHCCTIHDAF